MSYKSKYTGKEIEELLDSAKHTDDKLHLMCKTGMAQTIINVDLLSEGSPFSSFEYGLKTGTVIFSDLMDKGLINPDFPFMLMMSIGEKSYDNSEIKLFRYIPGAGKPEDPDAYKEFQSGNSSAQKGEIFSISEDFLLLVPDNITDQTIRLYNFTTGSNILPWQPAEMISMKYIDEYIKNGGPDLSDEFNEIYSWFREGKQPPGEIEMTLEMQNDSGSIRMKIKLNLHGIQVAMKGQGPSIVYYKTPIIQNPNSGGEKEAIVGFLIDVLSDEIGIFIGNQPPAERLPPAF